MATKLTREAFPLARLLHLAHEDEVHGEAFLRASAINLDAPCLLVRVVEVGRNDEGVPHEAVADGFPVLLGHTTDIQDAMNWAAHLRGELVDEVLVEVVAHLLRGEFVPQDDKPPVPMLRWSHEVAGGRDVSPGVTVAAAVEQAIAVRRDRYCRAAPYGAPVGDDEAKALAELASLMDEALLAGDGRELVEVAWRAVEALEQGVEAKRLRVMGIVERPWAVAPSRVSKEAQIRARLEAVDPRFTDLTEEQIADILAGPGGPAAKGARLACAVGAVGTARNLVAEERRKVAAAWRKTRSRFRKA